MSSMPHRLCVHMLIRLRLHTRLHTLLHLWGGRSLPLFPHALLVRRRLLLLLGLLFAS